MQTYKITNTDNLNWSLLKNFASLQDAQAYAQGLGNTYSAVLSQEQIPEPTDSQKLESRQAFGKELLNEYLIDNDKIAQERGYPFTVEETAQQAQKFQLVMGILPLGSLRQCLTVIENTAIDTIFTQARKDKYIAKLNAFIATQE